MKFIPLSIISAYFSILSAFAQSPQKDNSFYYNRQLKIEEINFVSGYYDQDGNNSAVTGGIGTEKLSDISNMIDLTISKYDRKHRQHRLMLKLGIDSYTSASSDHIDDVLSSASRKDTHIYPSLSWSLQNEKRGTRFGFTGSSSQEYDYTSYGTAFDFSQKSKDQNREFSFNAHAFFDIWKVILPVELRLFGYGSGSHKDHRPVDYRPRNSFSAALLLSQIINQRTQVLITLEPAYQHGLLATKYQRVYFVDQSAQVENLPEDRYKWPISLRVNYFSGDRLLIRSFYRYYFDSWGMQANTVDLELPVKINPFFSLSPFYRFHTQTAARYFAAYAMHALDEQFYTSDYDLSKLQSHFLGAGLKITPPQGIGWNHFHSIELRYGHYMQSNNLQADSFSFALKLK